MVTTCPGQIDGNQDQKTVCDNYIHFIVSLHRVYHESRIVLLTSPKKLTAILKLHLTIIASESNMNGDNKVSTFFYNRSYNSIV